MALTAAQLTTYYTTANQGVGPSAAQQAQINAIASQNLTDLQAQIQVGALLQATVAVAALSYAYFGNTLPSAAGMGFLVNSAGNPNDLNDAYYAQFNQENRFLNFALNLTRAGGDYAASFAAKYGILDYAGTVSLAYEEIISSAAAQAAGVNPVAGKAFFLGSLGFYQQVVTERGGLSPNDPTFATAVKAAIVGSIINEAIKAHLGVYSDAYDKLIVNLEQGITTGLGTPLLTAFPPGGQGNVFTANVAGFNTGTASNSVENVTTTDGPNTINATFAQLNGATVDGKGGSDTLNITSAITAPAGLGGGGSGGFITNVETVVLKNGSTALVGIGNRANTGIASVVLEQAGQVQLGLQGGQSVTGSSGGDSVTTGGGSVTISTGAGADTISFSGVSSNAQLDGGDGADTLNIATGAGLTGTSSLANIETVAFSGAAVNLGLNGAVNDYLRTVTVTGLGGANDGVVLSASGAQRGLAGIEDYALNGSMTFTLGAAGQSVSALSGAVNIIDDAFAALSGVLWATGGDDTLTLDRGGAATNISTATLTGVFSMLNIRGGGTATIFDNQLGSFTAISGASSVLTGNITLRNSNAGNVSTGTLTNIALLDAVALAPSATLTVNTASNITVALDDSSLTGNGTGAYTINMTGANATVNLNNGGDDTVSVGNVVGGVNIRTGSGNDLISFDTRSQFGANDTVNGGAGTDTLTVGPGAVAPNDFDNVTGIEIINDSAGVITSDDGLIAAGASLIYLVTGGGVANVNFTAETNGSVSVVMGSGGGIVRGPNNSLSDSYTALAGHAATTFSFANLLTGNTVAQVANVDTIAGLNGAIDKLDLPRQVQNGVIAANVAVNVTSVATFIQSANDYLTGAGKSMALGDVLIFQQTSGVGGVYFLVQNQSGSNVDAGDFVVRLSGSVTDPQALNFATVFI